MRSYFESTSCDCSQKWKASPVRVTNPLQQYAKKTVLLKYYHCIDYEDSQDCKKKKWDWKELHQSVWYMLL